MKDHFNNIAQGRKQNRFQVAAPCSRPPTAKFHLLSLSAAHLSPSSVYRCMTHVGAEFSLWHLWVDTVIKPLR